LQNKNESGETRFFSQDLPHGALPVWQAAFLFYGALPHPAAFLERKEAKDQTFSQHCEATFSYLRQQII
jgi:hypothetical protein